MQQEKLIERRQYMQQLRNLKDQNIIKVISSLSNLLIIKSVISLSFISTKSNSSLHSILCIKSNFSLKSSVLPKISSRSVDDSKLESTTAKVDKQEILDFFNQIDNVSENKDFSSFLIGKSSPVTVTPRKNT